MGWHKLLPWHLDANGMVWYASIISAYTTHILLTQRNQTTTCCDMRTVFKKATRNSCPPKTREANPQETNILYLGWSSQNLFSFAKESEIKSWSRSHRGPVMGDECPTCPNPPKTYITQHVGERHQFQALLAAGTQKLRPLIGFQTFISGLSALLSFSEVLQKGPVFQMAPPFWEHS